jgi:hypothetical protein
MPLFSALLNANHRSSVCVIPKRIRVLSLRLQSEADSCLYEICICCPILVYFSVVPAMLNCLLAVFTMSPFLTAWITGSNTCTAHSSFSVVLYPDRTIWSRQYCSKKLLGIMPPYYHVSRQRYSLTCHYYHMYDYRNALFTSVGTQHATRLQIQKEKKICTNICAFKCYNLFEERRTLRYIFYAMS